MTRLICLRCLLQLNSSEVSGSVKTHILCQLMCKNVHAGHPHRVYLCAFCFALVLTTLNQNGLFWAASWALCALHKREDNTGIYRRSEPESIQACNIVPFNLPHSSDFSQANTQQTVNKRRTGKGKE